MTSATNETTNARQPFDPAQIEEKWRAVWTERALYTTPDDSELPNWYSLTMYPYPSGTLHVGHWYAFAVPDSFARYQRMIGYNVVFPMGFDAFGLPAENAAIRNNEHPAPWTYTNIELMREQFHTMGVMIDWSRELASCKPDFYQWNQWFFLEMLQRGLAYRAMGPVWWCPNDQTVLANEQVLEGNVCERCGASVYRRDLEQWYFRITEYAEELLHGLDALDWPERVKTMQRNWIGRSEGARLKFTLETGDSLEVFTTRPDTVWGATFMAMAPEHPLVASITSADQQQVVSEYIERTRTQSEIERMSTDAAKPKTGVFTGGFAINPVNDERIPVWIADYVLMGYGTGAIMAVPAHDERDFAFAETFNLQITQVIAPADGDVVDLPYVGPGVMVNSGQFNGTPVPEQIDNIIAWLETEGRGRAEVIYRLRDWLISRQRYWGTPFPIVYCDDCGMVPLQPADLPVILPLDAEFAPTGQSPLVSHETFVNTTCPNCGKPARRETDTMDTFVDSSWYWYRYTSPHFEDGPFDPERASRWTPVDLYSGGIEHAILHLLYARFFTKVLRDIGLVDHDEPFIRLRNQGMILSSEGTKMSKSRGTQVSPDDLVAQYGADALRLHLMYLGPWDQGGPWNWRGITGMERFIRRAFLLVHDLGDRPPDAVASADMRNQLLRLTHRTIQRVSTDLVDFQFNTMVAALIEFVNGLNGLRSDDLVNTAEWREALETLTLLMAPSTPFVAEEMWQLLGRPFSVHTQQWPQFDPAFLVEDVAEMVIQVNGKVRDRLLIETALDESAVRDKVLASDRVMAALEGRAVQKVVVVPGRLVNIVAS